MTQKNFLLLLITIQIMANCKEPVKPTYKHENKSKNNPKDNTYEIEVNDLSAFLNRALKRDTLISHSQSSYFITGYFFNNYQKYTIAMFNSSIEVYKLNGKRWRKIFKDTIDVNWVQASCYIKDMNFDSKKDLIVHRSASNGFVQAYTHLYIYKNDSTFYKVLEADTIPNLETASNKQLKGEYAIICKENGTKTTLKKYFRWKKDKIEYIKTETPCLPE